MLFKGTLVTAASGKMGGLVASHNRGGQYFRNLVIPTDPSSSLQQAVRGYLAQLADRFKNTLTVAQQTAWATYALNTPRPNRLGDNINIGAIGHYIRSNLPRLQAGLDLVDDGPTTYGVGNPDPSSTLSVTGDSTTGGLSFDEDAPWVDEDGGALLVWTSRPQSPTINYFTGPYQFTGAAEGDSSTAPTSPLSLTLPFVIPTANACFFQSRISRADGRLSDPFRGLGVGI